MSALAPQGAPFLSNARGSTPCSTRGLVSDRRPRSSFLAPSFLDMRSSILRTARRTTGWQGTRATAVPPCRLMGVRRMGDGALTGNGAARMWLAQGRSPARKTARRPTRTGPFPLPPLPRRRHRLRAAYWSRAPPNLQLGDREGGPVSRWIRNAAAAMQTKDQKSEARARNGERRLPLPSRVTGGHPLGQPRISHGPYPGDMRDSPADCGAAVRRDENEARRSRTRTRVTADTRAVRPPHLRWR